MVGILDADAVQDAKILPPPTGCVDEHLGVEST